MSEKIVQLNEEIIKGQIRELVRGSVEETLNELLEKEAESLTHATLQRTVAPILNVDVGFLFSSLMVVGETLLPHKVSVMSSTRRTETPARYISMRASSTLLSRRRYRSMMAVSKDTPLSLGIWSVTSPDVVVRLRS